MDYSRRPISPAPLPDSIQTQLLIESLNEEVNILNEENAHLRDRLGEERFLLTLLKYNRYDIMFWFSIGMVCGILAKVIVDWR